MKIPTAKRLTFVYFSVVAFALITIHASVFQFTTEDIEHLYATNRLDNMHRYVSEKYKDTDLSGLEKLEVSAEGSIGTYYFKWSGLPPGFPDPATMAVGEDLELKPDGEIRAFIMKRLELVSQGQSIPVLLTINNSQYELSEEQLLAAHFKQIVISAVLLIISLFVVMKIADRLTRPISCFARNLSERSSDDLTPMAVPEGTSTQELLKMVETFNVYQQRIASLLERERAFNRYTSHELRTPLMVMQGAITLLGESSDAAFVEKQRQRLQKATSEMTEFTETLLSLSKSADVAELMPRLLDEEEVQSIVHNHLYLLSNKPVSWQVNVAEGVVVRMPEAALHILLGNLIKNAFACVEQGSVSITVRPSGIQVTDTGPGLLGKPKAGEGFGLGLLLVRDICHRFGWQFELADNDQEGCTASVEFSLSSSAAKPVTKVSHAGS